MDASLDFERDGIYTEKRASPRYEPSRQWKVLSGVKVFPVVKSPLKNRDKFLTKQSVTTEFEFFFNEEMIHIVDRITGISFTGYEHVFVRLPSAIEEDGNLVVGFLTNGEHIKTVSAVDVSWLKVATTPTKGKWTTADIKPTSVTTGKARSGIVPIESSTAGKHYEVVIYHDKTVSCPCKGWINNRKCRHSIDTKVLAFINLMP